jgi:teichuronic acid exporter
MKAIVYVLLELLGSSLISIASTMVLARLLGPTQYGALSGYLLLFGVISGIVDSGIGGAIVRESKLTPRAIDTAFWFIMLLAFTCMVAILFNREAVANFIRLKEDLNTVTFGAMFLPCSAAAIVPRALLIQQRRNVELMNTTLIANGLGALTAICFGAYFKTYWALLLQQGVIAFVNTSMLVMSARWSPTFRFEMRSLYSLLRIGISYTLIGHINSFTRALVPNLLATWYGNSVAGTYMQVERVQQLISDQIYGVVQRLSVPMFAHKYRTNNITSFRKAFLRNLMLVSATTFPIYFLMASLAPFIIFALLGSKWLDGGVLLMILALAGYLSVLEVYCMTAIKVIGHNEKYLALECCKRLTYGCIAYLMINHGTTAIAIGVLCSGFISFGLNLTYCRKLMQIRWVTLAQHLNSVQLGVIGYLAIFIVSIPLQNSQGYARFASAITVLLLVPYLRIAQRKSPLLIKYLARHTRRRKTLKVY